MRMTKSKLKTIVLAAYFFLLWPFRQLLHLQAHQDKEDGDLFNESLSMGTTFDSAHGVWVKAALKHDREITQMKSSDVKLVL